LGAQNVQYDYWTIGQFSAYLVMFALVARKSGMISVYITLWQKTVVSWERLQGHLEPIHTEKGEALTISQPATLKIENVGFGYGDNNDERIIRDFSLEASSGQIVGIAGPIASGKSTILKLLTTLTPTEGRITLNGIDISRLSTFQKSGIIAYKPHAGELFSGTIRENIVFDEVRDEDFADVLAGVALDSDIETISGGVNARIGGNVSVLSGGQRDRVGIARNLFANKNIILLDDPFSALDVKTEMQIIQYLRESFKNHLIIITSHRLAIFPFTDQVIFLDGKGGHIKGSHDELLAVSPLYKEIFDMQRGMANQ